MNIKEENIKKIASRIAKEVINELKNSNFFIGENGSCRLDEMARIGFLDSKYEVYVWTDDAGYIPHVHIRDRATMGREFETCVRLDTNMYFLHGHYNDVMNSSMKKDFAEFMEMPPLKNKRYTTNYEYAVDMWNDNNNSPVSIEVKYDENGRAIIPNYRFMEVPSLPHKK